MEKFRSAKHACLMDGRREKRIDLNGKDCAFFVNSKREDPLPLPFSTYIALYDPNMRAPLNTRAHTDFNILRLLGSNRSSQTLG